MYCIGEVGSLMIVLEISIIDETNHSKLGLP
jgi:hypothetical protein